jgi:hypothetical protein
MLDLELFHMLCKVAAKETDITTLENIRERMRELLLGSLPDVYKQQSKTRKTN